MVELKPCPNPECEDGTLTFAQEAGIHFIECISCGIRGPSATSWEEAKISWNALPPQDGLRGALERCQKVLAMLLKPEGELSGAALQNALAQCYEAEVKARAELEKLKP